VQTQFNIERPSSIHVRELENSYDLAALHGAFPQRYPFLLQSVAHGTSHSRYDILFAFPEETLTLNADGKLSGGADIDPDTTFLQALDDCWKQHYSDTKSPMLPFYGGWFVYLGYELAQQIEPSLNVPAFEQDFPIAFATRIPAAIIRDHNNDTSLLVAEDGYEDTLDKIVSDLNTFSNPGDATDTTLFASLEDDKPNRFLDGIERIKNYIIEGDVFQVNLSRAWRGKLKPDISDYVLYKKLCESNPSPFAGLVYTENGSIISSSPERLVKTMDHTIETRPIAGTRPRGEGAEMDNANRRELITHPKERAEHIMLIDLERNDLGRVCVPGSISVNELMVLESFAHVHHIISNVRGTLRTETTPGEVIKAVFPGGTITGCPKVRCMEIISELEATGRGPYTGSMGYINRDGSMDLNILIRSLFRKGEEFVLRTGAGIVADSIADKELDETRAKAKGLLLALES
jgi:anthranilate synthase component 1